MSRVLAFEDWGFGDGYGQGWSDGNGIGVGWLVFRVIGGDGELTAGSRMGSPDCIGWAPAVEDPLGYLRPLLKVGCSFDAAVINILVRAHP